MYLIINLSNTELDSVADMKLQDKTHTSPVVQSSWEARSADKMMKNTKEYIMM